MKKKVELKKLKGCEGCSKDCQFNISCATDRARQSREKYGCNNSK